jgi:hypothetical protein
MVNRTSPKKPVAKPAAAAARKATPASARPKPASAAPAAQRLAASTKAVAPKAKRAQSPMDGLANKVAVKAATAVKPAAAGKPAAAKEKARKAKLVRDSFTMPEAEYAVLGAVKKACLKAGFEAKKSQLLRVGVALLQSIETAKLKTLLATLPPLKAGRPKKEK